MTAESVPLFQRSLAELAQTVQVVKTTAQEHQAARTQAAAAWEQFRSLRESTLREILKEKGLDVCSKSSLPHKGVTELEVMGVFPIEQMRLHYRSVGVWRGGHGYEHLDQKAELLQLCQQHFPDVPNHVASSKVENQLDIYSEVIAREGDGRLVTVVNSIDVTDMPVSQYYPEALYRHFGLQALPERPRW